MSLHLYYYDSVLDQYVALSESGAMTSPLILVHNPDETTSLTQKIFLKNDDPTKYYTDVTLSFKPDSAVEDGNNTGWEWKILQQDSEPHAGDWATASSSVEITDVNAVDGYVGDASQGYTSYIPLWTQGTFVSGMPAGNYDNVYLNTSYTVEGNVTYA